MKKILLTSVAVLLFLYGWAQQRTVSGKVTSADDATILPGVNVLIKGTTDGGVTDANGNFSVSVSGSGQILVFSFIGFQTQEVPVGERTVVDVQLATDVKQLTEV